MNHTPFISAAHSNAGTGLLPYSVRVFLYLLLTLLLVGYEAVGQTSQPASAPAEPTAPAKPAAKPYNLLTTPQLTGDWGGVRTALKDVGFSISPVLIGGYQQNDRGGLNTRNAHDVPGAMQYNMEFDFDKMKLIPGGSFFIRGLQSWNDGVRGDVGSLTTPGSVWGSSGDHEILADKWWWRQRFLDDRVEIRLGKLLTTVDLFDVNAYAGSQFTQFSNTALVSNPVIPSSKGIGAFLKVWPLDWAYFQMGAMDPEQRLTRTGFDTAFHGVDHFRAYWEFGMTPKFNGPRGKLPGNYRFGTWYDPAVKTVFKRDPLGVLPDTRRTGDVGFYTNFDQLVWKEKADAKDKQGLGLFARYGFAHGEVNRVNHAWSTGAQYEGLLPDRDKDVLGFGVAQLMLSEQYRHNVRAAADRETVYELYYAIHVTPWLVLTPDVQIITNPGGDKTARDSIVGGVRVRVAF